MFALCVGMLKKCLEREGLAEPGLTADSGGLSGLMTVFRPGRFYSLHLGRDQGAFSVFTASSLPSAQNNFYVKEAHSGVTYSGFFQV